MGATELMKNEGNEGTKDLPWPLLQRDYSFSKVFSKSERKTVNVGDTNILGEIKMFCYPQKCLQILNLHLTKVEISVTD